MMRMGVVLRCHVALEVIIANHLLYSPSSIDICGRIFVLSGSPGF